MDKGLIYSFIITALIISSTLYLYSIDKKPTIKMIFPWLIFLIILGICMVNNGTSVMDAILSTSIAIVIPLLLWIVCIKGKFDGLLRGVSKLYKGLGKPS